MSPRSAARNICGFIWSPRGRAYFDSRYVSLRYGSAVNGIVLPVKCNAKPTTCGRSADQTPFEPLPFLLISDRRWGACVKYQALCERLLLVRGQSCLQSKHLHFVVRFVSGRNENHEIWKLRSNLVSRLHSPRACPGRPRCFLCERVSHPHNQVTFMAHRNKPDSSHETPRSSSKTNMSNTIRLCGLPNLCYMFYAGGPGPPCPIL